MKYLVIVDSKRYVARADPRIAYTPDKAQALRMSRAQAGTVQGQVIRDGHRATVIEATDKGI